jgi:hypothetical protein
MIVRIAKSALAPNRIVFVKDRGAKISLKRVGH